MQESSPAKRSLPIQARFFFILLLIAMTSWGVYDTNVRVLEHSRNFVRTLHFHLLEHQIIGVYWFGQEMLNFPNHQYFTLTSFQQFLLRMRSQMMRFNEITYGEIDQKALDSTQQWVRVLRKDGQVDSYSWDLESGTKPYEPFDFQDLQQIKKALLQSVAIHFDFSTIDLGAGRHWHLRFAVQPFSQTSIIVRLETQQLLQRWQWPLLQLVCGIILAIFLIWQYAAHPSRRLQNFPYYFLCIFLTLAGVLGLSGVVRFEVVFMAEGVACCSAWLCAVKFYTRQQDYKLSFLLGKSYMMIGRLFASFGPLLIAFSLFGYCVFCRYAGQFSSLWRTFMSLFYICYYNMTYESAIVTSRSNPVSMLFFIIFVLLFTICIYSGMLVSVFCSYVWGKREEQIKKDITNNLRIQCSACQHKYKYTERAHAHPKKSFNLSQFLKIDFHNPEECAKYKRVMAARIMRLRAQADQLIEEGMAAYRRGNTIESSHQLREDLWAKNKLISGLIGE